MPFKFLKGKNKSGDLPSPKDKDKDKKGNALGARKEVEAASPGVAAPTGASPVEYKKKQRQYSKPIEVLNEIFYREQGTVMDRVTPARKPQEVCVCFSPRTFLISWYAGNARGRPGTQIGQSNSESF
jgi:hypothetical protein